MTSTMTARMDLAAKAPAAYKAMLVLDRAAHQTALPKPLLELVKLRASQINGCVYCVDMHGADAKAGGETDARLFAVAVWRDAPFFTEAERAAFALTEAMTRLSQTDNRVPDEVWKEAAGHFADDLLAQLVMVIVTINAWNRICVTTRMVPESFQA
jgi:AhpD family alkylhydroperoxidase